ncbi:MAG: hypothetical protein ACON3Z_09400 [Bradymonadia bacterium]
MSYSQVTVLLTIIMTLLIMGCDDGASTNVQVLTADASRRIADANTDGSLASDAGATTTDSMIRLADVGNEQDGSLRPLENCQAICDFYVECDRLDLWSGRQRSACIEACEAVDDLDAFNGYRACLQTTSCGNLQECRLPMRPRPMCPEVCEALAACDGTARLPGALPGILDCEAGCDRPSISVDIRRCGEQVVADGSLCDESEFARCMLEEQSPSCLRVCELRVACGEAEDAIDCAIQCVTADEPEDPLARRRSRIEANCAETAATCEAFQDCLRAGPEPVDMAAVERLCEADAGCGFFTQDCSETVTPLVATTDSATQECIVERLTNDCGTSFLDCLRPAFPAPVLCDEFCAVSAICGTLPPGQLELECVGLCREIVETRDRERLPEIWRGLNCAYAQSCDEFSVCTADVADALDCDGLCALRDECELQDAGMCEARCDEDSGQLRNWAERLCTQVASGCDNVALCVAPEGPPCGRLCEPYEACGIDLNACVVACDDRDFLGQTDFLERYACTAAAMDCDQRLECRAGNFDGGFACLNWCRHELDCANDQGDMLDCLDQCGTGLQGADGISFAASYDCLEALGADGDCVGVSACLEQVDPAVLCEASCAEQQRCLLLDEQAPCEAACLEQYAAGDFERLQCVLNARRTGAGCATVAECIGAEVEPANADCVAFCERRAMCDESYDVFLCQRECTPPGDDFDLRNRCEQIVECDDRALCDVGDGMIPEVCIEQCAAQANCEGIIGEGMDALYVSTEACQIDCAANGLRSGGETLDSLAACMEGIECDSETFAGCIIGRPPVDCGAGWDAIVACNNQLFLQLFGMINGRADYIRVCEEQYAVNPMQVEADLTCLTEAAMNANGDPALCIEQVNCLLGGLGP